MSAPFFKERKVGVDGWLGNEGSTMRRGAAISRGPATRRIACSSLGDSVACPSDSSNGRRSVEPSLRRRDVSGGADFPPRLPSYRRPRRLGERSRFLAAAILCWLVALFLALVLGSGGDMRILDEGPVPKPLPPPEVGR